jgi:hypothetical protein
VGQKQKSDGALPSSAFLPGADIAASACDVRKVLPEFGLDPHLHSYFCILIEHEASKALKGRESRYQSINALEVSITKYHARTLNAECQLSW